MARVWGFRGGASPQLDQLGGGVGYLLVWAVIHTRGWSNAPDVRRLFRIDPLKHGVSASCAGRGPAPARLRATVEGIVTRAVKEPVLRSSGPGGARAAGVPPRRFGYRPFSGSAVVRREPAGASRYVEIGLLLMEQTGERWIGPELHRLKSEVIPAASPPDSGRGFLNRARVRRTGRCDPSTSRMISSFSAAGYLIRGRPHPRSCFF